MHPFQIIMIISATALASVTVLFYVIRSMPTRPGVSWWLTACLTQSIAYTLGFIFFDADKNIAGDLIFFSLQMLGNQGCALGLMLFLGATVDIKQRAIIFAVSLGSVLALGLSDQLFLATAVVGLYCAVSIFQPALIIYKQKMKPRNYRFLAVMLVLMGIHLLDYPFLRNVEWFAPVGFLFATILTMSIFLCLAHIALMQFKEHTQASEQRAIRASITDPLTGLYNRSHLDTLFTNHATDACESGSFAMLYLDLDGFKGVNDTFGHKAGDFVLTVVAERLTRWVGNAGNVVRVGGDELIVFIKIQTDANPTNLRQIAQEILAQIEAPITNGEHEYNISSSIGVCDYESDRTLDGLIQCSDRLMYLAKQAGGRCIFVHNEVVDEYTESESSNTTSPLPA